MITSKAKTIALKKLPCKEANKLTEISRLVRIKTIRLFFGFHPPNNMTMSRKSKMCQMMAIAAYSLASHVKPAKISCFVGIILKFKLDLAKESGRSFTAERFHHPLNWTTKTPAKAEEMEKPINMLRLPATNTKEFPHNKNCLKLSHLDIRKNEGCHWCF